MSLRCLSLLLLLAGAPALSRELRVCADPDNLPYSRADESGFENRIARLMSEELGAKLAYTWHPQQRAFVRKTMGEKRCDVWIGVPSDFERVLTTRPYYRSTYVFVWKRTRLDSFEDPKIRTLRIGVQVPGDDFAATPPGHALVARGAIGNIVGFPVHGARRSAERMVEAIAAGEIDAGLIWGPQAGYFAAGKGMTLSPARAPQGLEKMPFEFAIAMGVRRGEQALRDALDRAIARRQADIDAVLAEYAVPRLP